MRDHTRAGGKGLGAMLRLSVLTAVALGAALLASCSVADEELATSESAPRKQQATVHKTTSDTTAYGYGETRNGRKTVADDAVNTQPTRASRTAYLGSAPYICSPSGFGQKSRCFLR